MVNSVTPRSPTTNLLPEDDSAAPPQAAQQEGSPETGADDAGQNPAPRLQTAQTSNVWDNFLANLPTPAEDYENPLLSIPGTRAYSSDPARYNQYVSSVLGDPADTVADEDLPANYNSPTPAEFLNWHPSVQLRYFRDNFTQEQINNGATVIGSGEDQIGVIRSDDKREIYIVNDLTKSRIYQMSAAEQERLGVNTVFKSKVAPLLDLVPNATVSLAQGRAALISSIDAQINKIRNPQNDMTSSRRHAPARNDLVSDSQVYIQQLELIKQSVSSSGILTPSDTTTEVNQIFERYERARNYYDVETPSAIDRNNSGTNFVTPDRNAGLQRGYRVFIEQENRILAIKQAEQQMLRLNGIQSTDESGNTTISRLDVPTIVALLQNQSSLKKQAIVAMRTEQLTQLNQLSQAYAEMQRLINETLRVFDDTGKDADKETHALQVNLSNASAYTKSVILMFEEFSKGGPHPIEKEYNITRPTFDMLENYIDYKKPFKRTQWERFSTQLSDAVTLLNPQLLTNDINQDNREQNRSYEQATSTVRRAFDLNVQIARGIG